MAGCGGNPLAGLTTLDDLAVADDAPAAAAVAGDTVDVSTEDAVAAALRAVEEDQAPTASSLFAGLFSSDADEANGAPVADSGSAEADSAQEQAAEDGTLTPEDIPAPTRAGFFSRLFGGDGDPATAEQIPTPVSNAPTSGLAGILGPQEPEVPTGPDARRVAMNTLLPFGEIATNCEVSRRDLGTKVEQASGYTLYDTIPNATALRTHYITGFKDRCARQFTAATALLGDVGTHEVVRYLPSNRSKPYSVTDNAYEEVKASYCGASRGQPCGSRLDRLARRTTFVTAYKRFASSPDWANILLHEGRVVAIGPK